MCTSIAKRSCPTGVSVRSTYADAVCLEQPRLRQSLAAKEQECTNLRERAERWKTAWDSETTVNKDLKAVIAAVKFENKVQKEKIEADATASKEREDKMKGLQNQLTESDQRHQQAVAPLLEEIETGKRKNEQLHKQVTKLQLTIKSTELRLQEAEGYEGVIKRLMNDNGVLQNKLKLSLQAANDLENDWKQRGGSAAQGEKALAQRKAENKAVQANLARPGKEIQGSEGKVASQGQSIEPMMKLKAANEKLQSEVEDLRRRLVSNGASFAHFLRALSGRSQQWLSDELQN